MSVGSLCSAAGTGDLTKVSEYLQEGVDVNATFYGRTALNDASLAGQIDVVKYLVEKGANINHVNSDGRTSLCLAINAGHYHVARYLLDIGADVNMGRDRYTPLFEAVVGGHNKYIKPAFIESLLDKGARVSDDAFVEACKGNIDVLEMLLKRGANVNSRDTYYSTKPTALMAAVSGGNLEAVNLLLTNGANLDETDAYGDTALMYGARYGTKNICKLLIEKGADTTIKNKHGKTAFVLASEAKHPDITELLPADVPVNADVKPSSVSSKPGPASGTDTAVPDPVPADSNMVNVQLQSVCKKCGNRGFEYDNYFKEYSCKNCGWQVKQLPG